MKRDRCTDRPYFFHRWCKNKLLVAPLSRRMGKEVKDKTKTNITEGSLCLFADRCTMMEMYKITLDLVRFFLRKSYARKH